MIVGFKHMTLSRRSKGRAKRTCWLAMITAMAFLPAAQSDDNPGAGTTGEKHVARAIRIVDQHGRLVPNGRRLDGGGQVFDVAVGPAGNKIRFVPDTLTISEGDTVR